MNNIKVSIEFNVIFAVSNDNRSKEFFVIVLILAALIETEEIVFVISTAKEVFVAIRAYVLKIAMLIAFRIPTDNVK